MAKANEYSIELSNCRNIASVANGPIRIARNHLNVFYGKNGTGKTTLCKAIQYIAGDESCTLESLESFKYQETNDPSLQPSIKTSGKIKGLCIFDDDWIRDHCFAASTLHKDAFELYVRNKRVRDLESRRKNLIGWLRKVLTRQEVSDIESVLQDLQKNLGKTKTNGEFSAASPIKKAFKSGSPIEPIPEFLRSVVKGCSGIEKAKWLKWHKGHPNVGNDTLCPYCGTENASILKRCREYDDDHSGDAISQWEKVASAYEKHSDRLSRHNSALLGNIVKSSKAPNPLQLQELESFSADVKAALDAISSIRKSLEKESNIDASQLVDELSRESSKLDGCKLFLKTKGGMRTSEEKALRGIHDSIERIRKTQVELDTVCNDLIVEVRNNISGHESEINKFLEECGYPYRIEITCNIPSSEAKVLLKSKAGSLEVSKPTEALSYGEQNALALMLFMHEAIKKTNGVFVLDDPISSFDYDKRYGVLYALFSNRSRLFSNNFNGKTVIVMTHDPLVISDLIGIQIPGVKSGGINGSYLSVDRAGRLTCTTLDRRALAPYTQQLYKEILRNKTRPRIFGYVRIRQYCELLRHDSEEKKTKYAWTFSLLSDIVHGRNRQETLGYHGWRNADDKKVTMCENLIERLTGWKIDFWKEIDCYSDCMNHLVDLYYRYNLSSDDKLLVVRLMLERDDTLSGDSSIMKRFADEACHIGGSYLFQLDNKTYDQVPFYVIDWCDKVAAEAKARLTTACSQ
ncbi:MAG: AAA family ATPase [Collinsella bouchesdurhonensis]|nr:AAA family ATPase [Collinsella bouchesdurhonensis]